MAKEKPNDVALLKYLEHQIESARKVQIAFGESAVKDVEAALSWRSEHALESVYTERHAKIALEQVKLGRELQPIYENLIDRLLLLARDNKNVQVEMAAIARLALSLKDWL